MTGEMKANFFLPFVCNVREMKVCLLHLLQSFHRRFCGFLPNHALMPSHRGWDLSCMKVGSTSVILVAPQWSMNLISSVTVGSGG